MDVVNEFMAKLKKASTSQRTLNNVVGIGIRFRGAGVTTALVAAASEKPGGVVVTHTKEYARQLLKDFNGLEFDTLSLAEAGEKLAGRDARSFVVLDNLAVTAMASAAAEDIENLRAIGLTLLKSLSETEQQNTRQGEVINQQNQQIQKLKLQVEMLEKQLVGNPE